VTELSGRGILAVVEGKQVLCGNQKLMKDQGVDCSSYKNESYGTEVLVAVEGIYAGCLFISDTVKKDAKAAIESLNKQGFVTIMLTGDAEENAKAVAEETGVSQVYAKLLPEDKVNKMWQCDVCRGWN
jgi:Cd2+/Zn2+-exporting ATPase